MFGIQIQNLGLYVFEILFFCYLVLEICGLSHCSHLLVNLAIRFAITTFAN